MKLDSKNALKEISRVVLKDTGAYGSFIFFFLALVAFFLAGEQKFAIRMFFSLVAVTVVVIILRLAYFKPRSGMKPRKYKAIYERVDNSSFPSIHVARSVIISAAFFVKAPFLLPLLVLMVLAVCASRIYFKRHDITDITAGGIIGLILGFMSLAL